MSVKKESFEIITNLNLQTSYGIIDSETNVKLDVTIGIQDDGESGWFEIYDQKTGGEKWYAEGGLWFNGKKLIEYDGVFELPEFIIKKLEEWGYEDHL